MTAQEHIRNIYGFDFPTSFYEFYEFAQRLNEHPALQRKYEKGLGMIGMYLAEPFDVFKADFDPNKQDMVETVRHYNDPPEFFTILSGDTDGLHWGFYIDQPTGNPYDIWVASYYSRDAPCLWDKC